ncbi:MAG: hypothetical protein ACEPOZ_03535 [Marinifilaceae bacterium]
MKRSTTLILLFASILLSYNGMAQEKKEKKCKPNEEIKVNKEYDEQGNLIRYDSTYVYTWSSDSTFRFNDSIIHPQMDEIRKMMKERFHRFTPSDSVESGVFGHPFFDHNFFGKDFFKDDFFSGSFPDEDFFKDFEKMMEEQMNFRHENMEHLQQHMDSIHRQFFEKYRKIHPQQKDSIAPTKRKINYQNSKTIQI